MPKTTIAYFDPLGVFSEIKDELKSKLPLVNLHWNPPSRPLRSIPSLDVELVEEGAVTQAAPKHQMLGISSSPYLKLMFVKCDDSETYKSSIRAMIREWLNNNVGSIRDPTEWLIIHYVPTGGKTSSGNRFKSSAFDKIRADFNSGSKKDRCIQIRREYSSELEYMEVWSEAMTRIKEAVLEAFGRRVDLYEEEVNKIEAKKNVLGWNFGTFFVMKEGLARSFENISLYEDALVLYDELETAFTTTTNLKTISYFVSSIGFDYKDSPPLSLLEVEADSQWRHQIMSNEISLFDFHSYLFARQARLLLQISANSSTPSIAALRIGELYLRLRTFLTEMQGLLQENRKNRFMVAEWTYNVVNEFLHETSWVKDGLSQQVSEGRGELILLSRKALETLAYPRGWKIEGVLAEISLDDDEDEGEGEGKIYTPSNDEITKFIENAQVFYERYRELTISASAQFELADRIRTVNRLSAQLALLDYQLGNYEKAYSQLENIPSLYSRQGWDLITASLLSVHVQCLVKLGKNNSILLQALELICHYKYLSPTEIETLATFIQEYSNTVPASMPIDRIFRTSVVPYVNEPSLGKYSVTVEVRGLVESEFQFDDATLTLHNIHHEAEKLVLRAKSPKISGKDKVLIECTSNKFVRGQFQVNSLVLSRNKLTLVKTFDEDPVIIEFFALPSSLWAKVRLSDSCKLPSRELVVELHCPAETEEKIESCKVSLTSLTPGMKLTDRNTKTPEVSVQAGVEDTTSEVSTIAFPFFAESDLQKIKLRATVSFTTSKGVFQHVFVDEVDIALAIDVTVHDFFRLSKLFSKFLIVCKKSEPVRIWSTKLKGSQDFKVTETVDENDSVAFPGGAVSRVYSVAPTDSAKSSSESLELCINHCYVKDECAAVVWDELERRLQEHDLSRYTNLVRTLAASLQYDTYSYALKGRFRILASSAKAVPKTSIFDYVAPNDRTNLLALLSQLVEEEFTEKPLATPKQLIIPVPLPDVYVVHQVEMSLPEADHFVIGDTISAKIKITTKETWATKGLDYDLPSSYVYEVVSSENWAFSGKRKNTFNCNDDNEFGVSLVPLRTGKIPLPKIDIYAAGRQNQPKMEIDYRNAGETALVVPEFGRLTINF